MSVTVCKLLEIPEPAALHIAGFSDVLAETAIWGSVLHTVATVYYITVRYSQILL